MRNYDHRLCVIPTCRPSDRLHHPNLSFHRIPNNNNYWRQKWINLVRELKNDCHWEPSKQSLVCSRHFPSHLVQQAGNNKNKRVLIGNPVPSLLLCEQRYVIVGVSQLTEPPSGPQSVHPGTSCFLCSTLITNVPHNDHITRQIHLFKELLNEEGFKQGLVNDASSSLMYPADGRKSCTDCLTMVGKVWELDREILTLRERIRTIVQTSLRDNAEQFTNRRRAEIEKRCQLAKQIRENISPEVHEIDESASPKIEQIHENVSTRCNGVNETCNESLYNWVISVSTPDPTASTRKPDRTNRPESDPEYNPSDSNSSSNSYQSSAGENPTSSTTNHSTARNLKNVKRTNPIQPSVPPKRKKIENNPTDDAVFSWSLVSTPNQYPGATSCTRKKPGPIDPAEIPESNPPSCINVDENPVDNDDGSSTVSAPFLEYIDDDDEIYQSGMKPCIVLDDPDEPENIPVKMEEDECLFEFEDAEEMPTASGSHLNEPGIKSTKPGSQNYVFYDGNRPFGCSRCTARFASKIWVMRHMNSCKENITPP
ncbi:uncharacterized protein LOC110855891 [Folsomia candida]|uniref:uncharacterized protein LOC110855891 n=1 Tax=Folsomia candida TaxID=158441 RepID=UPI000B901128|nr:uncharacterized protein LOC110855891 [Folsomia candida]XP_021959989.1 uncharacterized protein LOC110855891 [Folsomia candida]XP_021959990.1 uncharacterized protein LOC110855891 [Folsomia candida]XP_035712526.1 uncharacterized protein LOC110855891 [Folsomia candida]XP_035712527.1 uncharacterized protein LOC110855891 [Folsomia candida]XP_035712528.1 uncharacterized protein LOC110855891 [Folsomia candida]XP_035712529.1 uncharacterized protein LOC110855891 [Folsomia candida]XP_035712530.1 unc